MHQYIIPSGAVSLTAATAKTVLQLGTPATRRAKVKGISVSFASVTATDVPVTVTLTISTTAGTLTAVTPVKVDQGDPVALCTGGANATVEPTYGTLHFRRWLVTPVGGLFAFEWPLGDEPTLAVSSWVGLVCNAPQAQTVEATLQYQE